MWSRGAPHDPPPHFLNTPLSVSRQKETSPYIVISHTRKIGKVGIRTEFMTVTPETNFLPWLVFRYLTIYRLSMICKNFS